MSADPTAVEPAVQEDEPFFDPTLKKKKKSKKSVAFDDLDGGGKPGEEAGESATPEAEGGEAKPADEDADNLFGDLKKKKKKKAIPMDLGDESSAPAPAGDAESGDLDFSDLKKKKKKSSKKAAFDLEAFERELEESGGADGEAKAEGDVEEDPFGSGAGDEDDKKAGEQEQAWLGSDRDYHYEELLGRVFATLRQLNPSLATADSKKRYTIVPPNVQREGNKKTMFANVTDICKRMHRQPEHVIQFLFAELGTSGSIDGAQRLVIKGRFQQKQIENVLRRYIVEYVTCKTCKSPETMLTKDNRIWMMTCERCGSTRSVSAIKTGFQAQTTRRSLARTG